MRNEAPAGAAKTAAMNRAATLCGCAALCYLVARTGLTLLAGALLALRVPGASLSNPVGTGLLAATMLRGAVAAAALACPFLLLLIAPQPPVPVHRGGRSWPRLFVVFWVMMLAGNLLAGALAGPGASSAPMELPAGGLALAAAWLAVCLVPAAGEELLFRGLLQGWLRPFGLGAAVAGPAVLFALLHGRLPACVAALFGGLALGLCAEVSGSLVPGMVFHLYNNTLAFLGQYDAQYGSGRIAYYIFLFLPPLVALALLGRLRTGQLRPAQWRRKAVQGLGALRSPGYLTAAALTLACDLWQTFGR